MHFLNHTSISELWFICPPFSLSRSSGSGLFSTKHQWCIYIAELLAAGLDGRWQPSLHVCVCVLCSSSVFVTLLFPMPLLCQSLCVICRQLEVCGNRDLLLFSHMLLSTYSLFLALLTPLFVCLHVKSVALVSLSHTLPFILLCTLILIFSRPPTQGDVHWAVTKSNDKHHVNHTHNMIVIASHGV